MFSLDGDRLRTQRTVDCDFDSYRTSSGSLCLGSVACFSEETWVNFSGIPIS